MMWDLKRSNLQPYSEVTSNPIIHTFFILSFDYFFGSLLALGYYKEKGSLRPKLCIIRLEACCGCKIKRRNMVKLSVASLDFCEDKEKER